MKALGKRSLTFLVSCIDDSAFRRYGMWLAQLAIFAVSGTAAILLRFDFTVPYQYSAHFHFAIVTWLFVKLASFRLLHLHRGWWRYVCVQDVFRIALGNLTGTLAGMAIIVTAGPRGFPRSIFLIDFLICFLGTCGIRVAVRLVIESARQLRPCEPGKRVLIYGAGTAGQMLYRELRSNPQLQYDVRGFIDDNPEKTDGWLQGLRLVGTGQDLPEVVRRNRIDQVLIAAPSASGSQMVNILRHCHTAGVACKTVPGLAEMVAGRALTNQIRDVDVEDLLGRAPVRLDETEIRAKLQGKVVMVTGAAGSIGSELCRQIARFRPAGIVGFEIAESPLFEIEREMRQSFPDIPFSAEIGSIQNRQRLDEVLRRYLPSAIYHAAAYKHVPMMEAHMFEAIENNVFGSYNLAMAAAEHGVADFVMISSDKAVRPTNITGATKRVSELLLLALQNGGPKYVAVRFGNVLGSNGSVIPIFKRQIAAGGPVTVTHPEMRRFFMTIPEAAQLVLQSSVVGIGGQICVLDMGEPVKIVDLARNLILLSGLKPEEDIKIEFTGIRPGEKLYEELSSMLEETAPTSHEKIRIFIGNGLPDGDMLAWLDGLREICANRDIGALIIALKEIVPDYSPSAHLLKRVIGVRAEHVLPVMN